MEEVGVRELKERASAIVHRVCETKEPVTITLRGRPVARLVPVQDEAAERRAADATIWAAMDELAEEIGKHWPHGVSAVEAVREQRREL